MEVEFRCGSCTTANQIEFENQQSRLVCANCGKDYGSSSEFVDAEERVQRCGICHCKDLYTQRDFNRKLGLAIVVIGAVLAPFTKLISLFVCAFIDLLLYWLLPAVTICYRCHSIFRGFTANPQHESFNLGINDHYRAVER